MHDPDDTPAPKGGSNAAPTELDAGALEQVSAGLFPADFMSGSKDPFGIGAAGGSASGGSPTTLAAHELVHTNQQGGGTRKNP